MLGQNSGYEISPGARVKVLRDPRWVGPWPAEPLGTVEPIMGKPFNLVASMPSDWPRREDGTLREFMVVFDEPQLDGDGDGPYEAAVIWETYLTPVVGGSVDDTPAARDRRIGRDHALRYVMEHPGEGHLRL